VIAAALRRPRCRGPRLQSAVRRAKNAADRDPFTVRQPMIRPLRSTTMFLAVVAALGLVACDKGGAAAPGGFSHKDDPKNLTELVGAILAASEKGDTATAAAMTRALIPDEAALKKALRDDAPASLVSQLNDSVKQIPADDAKVAGLIRRGEPGRTEIVAHAATTEELQAYAEGSVAFSEFPNGSRRLADSALRPGVTFYEVEIVEPGKDSGMKYHLFYWDGARWRMLGPAWRGLE
jgi:hypothetical protein